MAFVSGLAVKGFPPLPPNRPMARLDLGTRAEWEISDEIMAVRGAERRIAGWCALCRSRCGCINVVRDGRLVAVEPNPNHPTGRALCAKGYAAPELVHHEERLRYPLRRTRPKGEVNPGWKRISWDEALGETAEMLRRFAAENGPETVAFAPTTPSGTAISDSIQWIERLIRAYGSPNNVYGTEICNWHKDFAHAYTYGTGIGTPDFAKTGCIVLWGHNPSATWLAQAERITEAKRRGAKLVVIDPRRAGLAAKADQWLRVRPGTDGVLALSIAGVMIEEGSFDEPFMRDWTNGPFLIRDDEDRPLTEADLSGNGSPERFIVWDEAASRAIPYDPERGCYETAPVRALLTGSTPVATLDGTVVCRPAFERYLSLTRGYSPARAEKITGVPAAQIRETARLLWTCRPVSYHAWSGVGQHENATQTDRAIACLYALTGSFDAPGGNVYFSKVQTNDVAGADLMPTAQRTNSLGFAKRPLGPARDWWTTADEFYRAILEGEPYRVRGLIAFGTNLLMSRGDTVRGIEALKRLAFYVHADLFMNPSAAYADIVLPVTSPWEHDSLRIGFEIDQAAVGLVQYRHAAVEPVGEARSDMAIVFDLAVRLGLGDQFWQGDLDAGWRYMLEPSGLDLALLREQSEGVRVELTTRYKKYAEGTGFATPSGKVEIWSETFRRNGQSPLPEFKEPTAGSVSGAQNGARYPLILTSAKNPLYCHSQHRNLPRLRRRAPDPSVELHPDTASARGIAAGDWVTIETVTGRMRGRARLKDTLEEGVVVAEHGWWQDCPALGLDGFPVTGESNANMNGLVSSEVTDPISGAVPHRAIRCQVSLSLAPN